MFSSKSFIATLPFACKLVIGMLSKSENHALLASIAFSWYLLGFMCVHVFDNSKWSWFGWFCSWFLCISLGHQREPSWSGSLSDPGDGLLLANSAGLADNEFRFSWVLVHLPQHKIYTLQVVAAGIKYLHNHGSYDIWLWEYSYG
jgi:hypothetical protein